MADSDAPTDSAEGIPSSYTAKLGPTADDDGDRDPEAVAEALRAGTEKWSNLSLDEIVAAYRRVIWPLLEDEDKDPQTTIPTRDWLRRHDQSNLEYALREYHGLSLSQFCQERLGVHPDRDSFEWATDDEATRAQLDRWLDSQHRRGDINSERTIRTKRARLQTYLRAYAVATESSALLDPVQEPVDRPRAYDEVTAAYDYLDDELDSSTSKYQYHSVIEEFYDAAVTSGRAVYNPTTGLMEERYGWESSSDESPSALDSHQIRRLYHSTETTAERMLVVALGAWGLRRGEVAALHRDQLVFEDEAEEGAYIEFSNRKNGPGTVALLYGEDVVKERLSELTEQWSERTAGYLFPSERSASGHISPDSVNDRFSTIVSRADIRLEGTAPTPKHCRRYWYDRYSTVMAQVDDWLAAAAEEQGSSSAEVLKQNYVPESRLRELRRERMREELADAFDHT
jgi:integrase